MIVTYDELAHAEIEAATIYYAKISADLARRFIGEFDRAIGLILDQPNAWPPIGGGLRRLLVDSFPYQTIYRVEDDKLRVYAFAHVKRKPRYWRKRVMA